MKYLVTGAAGFIASKVAKNLLDKGNSVVTIDNLTTGYEDNIPKGVQFIRGNVFDDAVIKQLEDTHFDAILHIAGQSSGEISFENPIYDLQTNCQSTLMLLEYAKRTGCQKFLYASTMSVYGDHNPPECKEQTETIPKSFYAVGKLASEHYMRIYSQQYGITSTALRLFNTYGVGQNLNNMKQGMASIYLAMAIKNKEIIVKGSKDRFRDFVYVDDVVDAFIKALERKGGYKCYNVCTGKATKVEDVVANIINNVPYEVSIKYEDGTPGDQFGIYGNGEKIAEDIGWKPQINFNDGMNIMVKWAMEDSL